MADYGENKRTKTEGGDEIAQDCHGTGNNRATAVAGTTLDLNFPIPGMKGTPCLVKVSLENSSSRREVSFFELKLVDCSRACF